MIQTRESGAETEKSPPKTTAAAARAALRRVLWSIQNLAHASLPEITEEPVEVFAKRLEDWDKLCKTALEAENSLAQKKEERTLEWLERSAAQFEGLARPAVAPELADLASSVENAAKVWEKLALESAKAAGEAAWLERAWGAALGALAARVEALPEDARKRILQERVSDLRTIQERGLKILGAGASAGIRPLRRRRLAAFLSRRSKRLRDECRRIFQDDLTGLQELLKQADEQSGAMLSRALEAEGAKKDLSKELEALRERLAKVSSQYQAIAGTPPP